MSDNLNEFRPKDANSIGDTPPDPCYYRTDGWSAGRFDYERDPDSEGGPPSGKVARVWLFSPMLRDEAGENIKGSATEYQVQRNGEYLFPQDEAMSLVSAIQKRGRVSDLPREVRLVAQSSKRVLVGGHAAGKGWPVPSA